MIAGNSIKRDYKQTPSGFSKKLLALIIFLCNKTYGDSGNNRQDKGYSANFRLAWPCLLFFLLSDKAATYQQYQQLNDQC